jgi:hypothetical protein
METEYDHQDKPIHWHKRCNRPAAERVFGGELTAARAVLCDFHAKLAERECRVSMNGYKIGRVDPKARNKDKSPYRQTVLPGTGMVS